MGRYFDFEPVKPWAGGLAPIGNAMGDVADFMQKDKAERQRLALEREKADAYKAQVDAQVMGVKRADRRDQVVFDQAQQDRMRDTTQRIAALVSAGRYGEAEGMAASSRFEVPGHPGQMAGVGFERQAPPENAPVPPQQSEPMPKAPETPVFPSPNEADYYKVQSPAAARADAIARALGQAPTLPSQNPDDYNSGPGSARQLLAQTAGAEAEGVAQRAQHERGQYAADRLAHDVSMSAYDPAVQNYQTEKKTYDDQVARPNVALTYPTGQRVTMDPREGDLFKDYEAEHKAAQLLNAADKEADPVVAATMRRQASMIQAQLAAADKGAIGNAATASTAARARADLEAGREQSNERVQGGHDRARVTAAAIKAKNAGMLPGAEENRVYSEYKDNVKDVTEKGGLRDQIAHQEASLQSLRTHPEVNTNWTNAIDAMIRTNTGRAAIIAQYKMYTGKTVGWEDAANQFMEWATTNSLSPAQKRDLFAAMKSSYNNTVDQWDQAYDVASEYDTDQRVQSSPALRLGIERTKHSTFRGGKRKHAEDAAVPGLPDVKLTPDPTPAAGKRIKLRNGETGTLAPDGTFTPDVK